MTLIDTHDGEIVHCPALKDELVEYIMERREMFMRCTGQKETCTRRNTNDVTCGLIMMNRDGIERVVNACDISKSVT